MSGSLMVRRSDGQEYELVNAVISENDPTLAALRKRVKALEAALRTANERIEVIHDEWAEPSASAAMGQIAAICLIASNEIDTALEHAEQEPKVTA